MSASSSLAHLLREVRACRLCAGALDHGTRPILQADVDARILIAGQAPGRRVHASGVPFDDASGERLRDWMGVTREVFYSPSVAILPMGFCYPGTGRSGDLPPRPECAPAWREKLLARLPRVELTLVLGQHAMAWHLGSSASVTATVSAWREHRPRIVPLPHPSPRNRVWVARNRWFESELLPYLRRRVRAVLS